MLPRLFFLTVLFAMGLSAPASALTISIQGLTVQGMGRCGTSMGGTSFEACLFPLNDGPPETQYENDGDPLSPGVGLEFDWLILDAMTESPASTSFTFSQTGHFGPGRTGGIATVPVTYHFDLPARQITATEGSETISQSIVQRIHLTIGMLADTIEIDAIGPIVFDFQNSDDVQVSLNAFGPLEAEGDPPFEITGQGGPVGQAPAPSALSLFGAALACMMGVAMINRRRKLIQARITR